MLKERFENSIHQLKRGTVYYQYEHAVLFWFNQHSLLPSCWFLPFISAITRFVLASIKSFSTQAPHACSIVCEAESIISHYNKKIAPSPSFPL